MKTKIDPIVAALLGVALAGLIALCVLHPDQALPTVLPTIIAFIAAFRGKVVEKVADDS